MDNDQPPTAANRRQLMSLIPERPRRSCYLVCPQAGKVFRTPNDTFYYRPKPEKFTHAWYATLPIRRVSHKVRKGPVTRRQILRNVSRSKFILKHNL